MILVITWIILVLAKLTDFNHAAKMTAKALQADWSEMGKIVQLNVKMAWPPWRLWSCTRLNSYLSGVVMFKWTTTPTGWSSSGTTTATSSRPSPGTEKHLLSLVQLAFNPRGCQLFQLVPGASRSHPSLEHSPHPPSLCIHPMWQSITLLWASMLAI